ncbi:restriction endonuclease subunit S [Clostridium thermosuccinogenes]|uniref:Restriction endonuclease subunit S n=1 Tax=Clostridium thermosuccinogenes TaxID=84032 RepID=A0A2K2F6X3_9CLOT|nr:restriction endonuclease subunit S [Pseudoclostridium thermosuccinogenes]AUS95475.1 restriction endonuclease subunit S [Pseudoclostridium thermosuccinogenes]PNT94539.1 restriction endonuclease subunit S [Pseudoclostridium thermosuccinogenes]PNT94988.1 restriction endonuclease subunit S [Pseudoclostridium thermosuccinogenes]
MSRYKRYERYKDSGVEWIGEIPEHWGVKPLKRVFKIINGGTPSSSEESYWNGEIVWVTPNDLSKLTEACIVDSERKITQDGLHNCSARIVPKGSIVISTRAPIGYVAIAGVPLCTNQGCKSLVAINKVNPKYFYYWMHSISFYLNVLGQGTTFIELSNSSLSMVELLTPSINEQKAIANFLDQKTAGIDGLIADKEKLIELLQEKRQAIITEAVTKGLNQNVKMKDSGIEWIGEIPEHWRLSKIKYESLINNKTLSESTDDDYEIEYIDISSVTSIGGINDVQSLNFKDAPSRARRILSKGDTIVSTVRTYLKAIAFIENTQSNLICSTGFAVLTPLSKVVPKYLFYLMRSEKYVNEIVRRSVGVSYPAVNASDIGDLECALPDRDEQMYIVEYLDNFTMQINQLVNDIQLQIQKLKEYRQSLISEAVTGKIDVREFGSISEVI